jgi:hypothetical protein
MTTHCACAVGDDTKQPTIIVNTIVTAIAMNPTKPLRCSIIILPS